MEIKEDDGTCNFPQEASKSFSRNFQISDGDYLTTKPFINHKEVKN